MEQWVEAHGRRPGEMCAAEILHQKVQIGDLPVRGKVVRRSAIGAVFRGAASDVTNLLGVWPSPLRQVFTPLPAAGNRHTDFGHKPETVTPTTGPRMIVQSPPALMLHQ